MGQLKTRTYVYGDASFDSAAAQSMSGLEYARAMATGTLGGKPSMVETLGMSVPFDLEHGSATIEAPPISCSTRWAPCMAASRPRCSIP